MRMTQGTFSYLPDLTDDEIRLQVQYVLDSGWPVSVEFTDDPHPRNIYWEMLGLPMFDLNDAAGVMLEVNECRKVFPEHYIRLDGYDAATGGRPPRCPSSSSARDRAALSGGPPGSQRPADPVHHPLVRGRPAGSRQDLHRTVPGNRDQAHPSRQGRRRDRQCGDKKRKALLFAAERVCLPYQPQAGLHVRRPGANRNRRIAGRSDACTEPHRGHRNRKSACSSAARNFPTGKRISSPTAGFGAWRRRVAAYLEFDPGHPLGRSESRRSSGASGAPHKSGLSKSRSDRAELRLEKTEGGVQASVR